MTTEEAIKTIETAIAEIEWEYPMDYAAAFDMALAALRAQAEEEKNEPLTLEELRELGGESVWVKVIDHNMFADKADDFDGWGLTRKSWVRVWDEARADLVHVDYDLEDYGKAWIAYRRKPEEAPADG